MLEAIISRVLTNQGLMILYCLFSCIAIREVSQPDLHVRNRRSRFHWMIVSGTVGIVQILQHYFTTHFIQRIGDSYFINWGSTLLFPFTVSMVQLVLLMHGRSTMRVFVTFVVSVNLAIAVIAATLYGVAPWMTLLGTALLLADSVFLMVLNPLVKLSRPLRGLVLIPLVLAFDSVVFSGILLNFTPELGTHYGQVLLGQIGPKMTVGLVFAAVIGIAIDRQRQRVVGELFPQRKSSDPDPQSLALSLALLKRHWPALLKSHDGQWVAYSPEGLIGVGKTVHDAVRTLKGDYRADEYVVRRLGPSTSLDKALDLSPQPARLAVPTASTPRLQLIRLWPTLIKIHPGEWVAITADGLADTGADLGKLLERLSDRGVTAFIVEKIVPECTPAMVRLESVAPVHA